MEGGKEEEPLYSCNTCFKTFKLRSSLKRHQKLHSDTTSLPCSVCEQRFTCESARSRHMESHRKLTNNPIECKNLENSCDKCSKTFKTKSYLKKHQTLHSDADFLCSFCPKRFIYESERIRHVESHKQGTVHGKAVNSGSGLKTEKEANTPMFTCYECAKTFQVESSLVRHKRLHSETDSMKCKFCEKRFPCESERSRHVDRVHAEERTDDDLCECQTCGKRVYSKSQLETHMRSHTNAFPCNECPRAYKNKESLRKHQKRKHTDNAKLFPCHECDYKFSIKSELNRHLKVHSGGADRAWPCVICGKRFLYKSHVEIHMRSHTKEKPFCCNLCNKAFTTNGKLTEHIKYTHSKTPEINKCPKCMKTFSRPDTLKRHLISHSSNSRPWKCTLCPKMYTMKYELTAHMLDHSEKRPFSCSASQCTKSFVSEVKLKRHEKLCHSGKKYDCRICQRQFCRKYVLYEHLRLHPGNHYSCGICRCTFNEKSDLDQHLKKHKTFIKKGYTCNICFKSVSSRKSLKRHLVSMHKPISKDTDSLNTQGKQGRTICTESKVPFVNNRKLKLHQNFHSEVKLFKCFSCHEMFARKESLFIHKKKSPECQSVISKAGNGNTNNIVIKQEPGNDATGSHIIGNDTKNHMTGNDITAVIKQESEDDVTQNYRTGNEIITIYKQDPGNNVTINDMTLKWIPEGGVTLAIKQEPEDYKSSLKKEHQCEHANMEPQITDNVMVKNELLEFNYA